MPDPLKPRHTVKVWAEADKDQAEFALWLAHNAREKGDSSKAAELEAEAAVLAKWGAFDTNIAPFIPKDAGAVGVQVGAPEGDPVADGGDYAVDDGATTTAGETE